MNWKYWKALGLVTEYLFTYNNCRQKSNRALLNSLLLWTMGFRKKTRAAFFTLSFKRPLCQRPQSQCHYTTFAQSKQFEEKFFFVFFSFKVRGIRQKSAKKSWGWNEELLNWTSGEERERESDGKVGNWVSASFGLDLVKKFINMNVAALERVKKSVLIPFPWIFDPPSGLSSRCTKWEVVAFSDSAGPKKKLD